MIGFHEVRFPDNLAYGTSSGPSTSVDVNRLDSGAPQTVQRWDGSLVVFDAAYSERSLSDLRAILRFYRARGGAANGFRIKDFMDFSSASDDASAPSDTDQQLGVGDGSTTQFQLIKVYESGSETQTRVINKPVSGSVVVSLDGVAQLSGWSVNTTNGIVTFTIAPAIGVVVRAGFEFDVPVMFTPDVGSGLTAAIQHFDDGDISSIPMVEIPPGVEIPSSYYYGGSINHGAVGANFQISHGQGRLHKFSFTSAGLKVLMPVNDDLPEGGPHFCLHNEGATHTAIIADSDGNSITVLGTESAVEVWLGVDSNGDPEWVVV